MLGLTDNTKCDPDDPAAIFDGTSDTCLSIPDSSIYVRVHCGDADWSFSMFADNACSSLLFTASGNAGKCTSGSAEGQGFSALLRCASSTQLALAALEADVQTLKDDIAERERKKTMMIAIIGTTHSRAREGREQQ